MKSDIEIAQAANMIPGQYRLMNKDSRYRNLRSDAPEQNTTQQEWRTLRCSY